MSNTAKIRNIKLNLTDKQNAHANLNKANKKPSTESINMNIKQHTGPINDAFNSANFFSLKSRSVHSIGQILLERCIQYNKSIDAIQKNYNQGNNIAKEELVACVIGCVGEKASCLGTSHGTLINYHRDLRKSLEKIGKIGEQSKITGSRNIIGKCAEVKAANRILQKDRKSNMANIKFTKPIRPRTMQKMLTCPNCIATFK